MQRRVDTKKVITLSTKLNSLKRLWLQTPTKYQQNMMIIKLLMNTLGHIMDMVRLDLEFMEDFL